MNADCYAEGGEVDGDHNELMNHVALEMMHAIEAKDKVGMLSALKVLISDIVGAMNSDEGEE